MPTACFILSIRTRHGFSAFLRGLWQQTLTTMSILKSASHFHGSSPGDLGWSRPSGWEHGDSLQVDHGVFKTLGLRTQGLPAGGPWVFKILGEHGGGSLQVVHGRALLLDNLGLLLTSLRPQFPHLESTRRVSVLQAMVRGSES